MSDAFNPAQRLYEILAAGRALDGAQPAREAWARILGVPKDDRAALFRALAQLAELADEIAASINATPDARGDLFLANLPALRKAIGVMQLESPWSTQLQMLSEAAVRDLLFCSEKLQSVLPERKIAPDSLAELAKEVDSLTDAVVESDIDDELRKVLLACLESFRRAIADYRIRGAGALRDAAVKTIGELLLVRDKIDPKDPMLRRIWEVLKKVDGIVAKAMTYKALSEAIRFALAASGTDIAV